MNINLDLLKKEIIRIICLVENNQWEATEILIQFPPTINKAYKMLPIFWDGGKNKIRIIPPYDAAFEDVLFDLIIKANKVGNFNEISFSTFKNDYENSKIGISYSQELVDKFEANLPESQKGKTKAWYISNIS